MLHVAVISNQTDHYNILHLMYTVSLCFHRFLLTFSFIFLCIVCTVLPVMANKLHHILAYIGL